MESVCGWAFRSVFPPCVAQRVWAMPKLWFLCRRLFSRTRSMQSWVEPALAYLVTTKAFSGEMVAMPAESYPRF